MVIPISMVRLLDLVTVEGIYLKDIIIPTLKNNINNNSPRLNLVTHQGCLQGMILSQ